MQYVNLGRSNLKVSRLGFGAMGIGDPSWRSWVLNEAAAGPILKRVLELGINFIDTCDYYSLGRSEEVLGRLLRSLARREEIVLATKVGNPMGQGPNARGFSRKHLNAAVNQSLRRLQTDYIDLYQTHIWDPSTHIEEMVDALRRRRIPFLYLLFDGEQHGFRRADNIKRALDAELYFYATFLTDQRLEFRVS